MQRKHGFIIDKGTNRIEDVEIGKFFETEVVPVAIDEIRKSA